MMRGLCLAILLCIACIDAARAIDPEPGFTDPAVQKRYEALTHQLRCLVCQNETIADSNATLAGDLRRELREQLQAGRSDAEVLQFMTDRYGAFVLYKPPFEQRTWLLWLGPALFLLIGAAVAVRIIVRRARVPVTDTDDNASENA